MQQKNHFGFPAESFSEKFLKVQSAKNNLEKLK